MPKSRKESYRVTITRPDTMKVSEAKKIILDGFQLAQMDCKVELVRGAFEEAPKSFWQRFWAAKRRNKDA